MSIIRPCPRCQHPLEIPQPTPEKIVCSKCGAVIKYRKNAATEQETVNSPHQTLPAGSVTAPVSAAPNDKKASPATAGPTAELPTDSTASRPRPARGFLTYLHSVIPKPVLFGLYGALGGLLGVLLLGELFWAVLHPEPPVVEPLKIAVAPVIVVYPGSQNLLTVKIARQGVEGTVRLEAVDLTDDLEIPPATIAADQTETTLQVKASDKAEPRDRDVKLQARVTTHDSAEVLETVRVTIESPPPTLQLRVSPLVTVYPGAQNRLGFIIARRLFDGPVRLEVLDLPREIQIPLTTLPDKVNEGGVDVVVGKGAKLGPHILPMEARSLINHRIIAREMFQLNIEPPPGKLQLAVSPQITVYPGTKNRFSVKIARQEFNGPIHLEVAGAPPGVQFTEATIPPDKTEAELEVFADKSAQVGGPPPKNLRIEAQARIAEAISASLPLVLRIEPPQPTVQLTVSPRVPVYPEGKAQFGVKITRHRFTGPVQVMASPVDASKNGFVSVPAITIPADQAEGTLELSVNQAALSLPLKFQLPMVVTARSMDGKTTTTEPMQVEIWAPPSDLQLTVSPEVELYQAGKCQFTVKVARSGFLGPVQVAFNNVPMGVTLPATVINGNEVILQGQASIDAVAKKYAIELVGTGPKAPDGKVPTTTQTMSLIVKPFDPSIRPPLDIVFVLDVTQSLDPQIAGLRDGIGQFVKALKDRELEARIGLVAFRDIIYDEVPFELLKFNGKLFTTDTKAFSVEVGKLKAMGGGDDPESSLDAIVKAANYPFRDNALRVLLLITDDKPQTKGNSVHMPTALKVIKDKKIDQVHLIVKKAHLSEYAALQKITKGGFFDFETVSKKTKEGEGFASLLPLLSREIATTIGAPMPVAKGPPVPASAAAPSAPPGEKAPEPKPEARPDSPRPEPPQPPKAGQASIIRPQDPRPPVADEVTPPRAEVPSLQGVQSTQVYADKDRFQLMIAIALWTAALAGGIAVTLVGAQKRYLRQAWLSVGEFFKALGAGMCAGLLAGILGQWFFQSTPGSAWWSVISRMLAWAILGGMIGAGMGFFVPNLKWQRSFMGGCIGGLIGAAGFVLISLHDAQQGRWMGAGLLGFCIGLMVALAEMAFRRYWLEIAFGAREIRTVTLGSAAVALGGDETRAGVYVPNAPPLALGFRVDKNRVYCEDFATGKTSETPPGEQRTVANVKVRVCSAANAESTGIHLQLVLVRDLPLMIGMPLTSDDIPGLEPQGADGIVALVSRRPNDPSIFLLRNRSKQTWTVTDAQGKRRTIEPGLGIELAGRCDVDFGQVKGTLDPDQGKNASG